METVDPQSPCETTVGAAYDSSTGEIHIIIEGVEYEPGDTHALAYLTVEQWARFARNVDEALRQHKRQRYIEGLIARMKNARQLITSP
jgi:hypothetical protein